MSFAEIRQKLTINAPLVICVGLFLIALELCALPAQVCESEPKSGQHNCIVSNAALKIVGHIAHFLNDNATVLNAFATIVIAAFTVALWRSTEKLWGVARQQATDTVKSLKISEIAANAADLNARAAIGIELPVLRFIPVHLIGLHESLPPGKKTYGGFHTSGVPDKFSAIGNFTIKNHGRTLAFPANFSVGWKVATILPEIPVYTNTISVNHALVIEPNHDITIRDFDCGIELSDEEIAQLTNESAWLWVYGSLNYFDFMDNPREARFCWRWANRNAPGPNAYYTFESEGNPPKAYIRAG